LSERARWQATPPTNYASSIVIDWNTFETCPNAPGHPFYVGGLSFGWVFIIVVCVGGVLYVGGGYAYNSQKNGLSGKDALPHQSFWQNVVQDGPELVADGVGFTRHKLATTFAFLEFLDPPPRKGQDPEDPFTDALEREKNSLVAPAGDGSGRKKKKKKKSSKDSKASSKDSKSKKKTYLDSEQEPEDPVQRVASVRALPGSCGSCGRARAVAGCGWGEVVCHTRPVRGACFLVRVCRWAIA
jgi:hypothetical protein